MKKMFYMVLIFTLAFRIDGFALTSRLNHRSTTLHRDHGFGLSATRQTFPPQQSKAGGGLATKKASFSENKLAEALGPNVKAKVASSVTLLSLLTLSAQAPAALADEPSFLSFSPQAVREATVAALAGAPAQPGDVFAAAPLTAASDASPDSLFSTPSLSSSSSSSLSEYIGKITEKDAMERKSSSGVVEANAASSAAVADKDKSVLQAAKHPSKALNRFLKAAPDQLRKASKEVVSRTSSVVMPTAEKVFASGLTAGKASVDKVASVLDQTGISKSVKGLVSVGQQLAEKASKTPSSGLVFAGALTAVGLVATSLSDAAEVARPAQEAKMREREREVEARRIAAEATKKKKVRKWLGLLLVIGGRERERQTERECVCARRREGGNLAGLKDLRRDLSKFLFFVWSQVADAIARKNAVLKKKAAVKALSNKSPTKATTQAEAKKDKAAAAAAGVKAAAAAAKAQAEAKKSAAAKSAAAAKTVAATAAAAKVQVEARNKAAAAAAVAAKEKAGAKKIAPAATAFAATGSDGDSSSNSSSKEISVTNTEAAAFWGAILGAAVLGPAGKHCPRSIARFVSTFSGFSSLLLIRVLNFCAWCGHYRSYHRRCCCRPCCPKRR
jgi:hypothetical protein